MCMSLLERRLQVLLSTEEYARIEGVARVGHRSVGSVVREAIRDFLDRDTAARTRALEQLLAMPPDDVPGEDWTQTKKALADQIPDYS